VSRAFLRSGRVRALLALAVLAGVGALMWWRGPNWSAVGDAFTKVRWEWVVVAIGINLASIVARSIAWKIVIDEAMPEPRPSYALTFSAFCVGLLANAVLPGRIGELARVAVINRRLPVPRGATLLGTVFAHRVFDLVPVIGLILYVLATAKIPAWAYSSLIAVVAVGVGLFVFALASARHFDQGRRLDGVGAVRRILAMMREGLGVMHRPLPAAGAIGFQTFGWICQLFAVYTAMRAFHIYEGVPAAAVVLLVMNVVNVIPLWPGNVGAVQAAIALPLTSYGVAYADGIAFGFGLQAIEASVGVGIGLVFLAREGLSFATLRGMPGAAEAGVDAEDRPRRDPPDVPASRPSARGRAPA
jgi:glycosyltransferase 2 family protein